MEAIIIPKDQFHDLITKVDLIHLQVSILHKRPEEVLIDNPEFIDYMHISKRTAQTWRDERRIPFTQIGAKIYYKLSDVMKLIEQNTTRSLTSDVR
ncbi:MAG: helix-turn-helix domain-containing protein [Prolixibacteraceae bacterium]|jgi:hypothetical protein|nr:helix-turn-helix domain-containing protein [Prolixibacteraceae bacterium]